ncbi:proline--tRNA ligase [Planctomycetales bacterium ZRK34]|nr:proline--tRNA ligase [Planctomycetales bacterium ZRK34]
MFWSRSLIPTLRQPPAEAVVPSHQLMLRAALVQQVAAGAYSYLPLGWRVLHKVMNIIRQEMNTAGAVEVLLPTLQPIELWEKTGRREAYGENLFVVTDRHGREQALGPTHEEVITDLVKRSINSYRDLPLSLYQIQTKFRDEFRPRFGVLRSREFQMKDAYSFHLDLDSLGETYEAMRTAYRNIFTRTGLQFVEVEAEAGPIGGNASHEFMVPSPTGEDTILSSDKNNYAANVEKCEIGPRPFNANGEETGELQVIDTPGCKTINDLCDNWKKFAGGKLKAANTLKTVIFKATSVETADHYFFWVAVVRGDHDVNEAKLRLLIGRFHRQAMTVDLIEEQEGLEAGFSLGYVGPDVRNFVPNNTAGRLVVIADYDAVQPGFWVTGANKVDKHQRHFTWNREMAGNRVKDVRTDFSDGEERFYVADIRNAVDGDPSPKDDGGTLREAKGIEIGHVFKLGSKYAEALGLKVLDEKQEERTLIMGCYGIGVNRIIAAAIESDAGHDERGIIWPMAIAPYHVLITPIKYEGQAKEVADDLAAKLTAAGVEVLIDDRDERPGVKFNDADLIGIPLRITLGDKGLAASEGGEVEFKPRTEPKAQMVPVAEAADRIIAYVRDALK